ncbi:MAG: hypothetical protein IPJ81_08480 [Chitinophagaceae bacterium]|nr:hypothetical protein [Chitinophagaceae bacterium]
MQNNKGGFTDDQNKALINKALGVSGGKDGSFLIQGILMPKVLLHRKTYKKLMKRLKNGYSKQPVKTLKKPTNENV